MTIVKEDAIAGAKADEKADPFHRRTRDLRRIPGDPLVKEAASVCAENEIGEALSCDYLAIARKRCEVGCRDRSVTPAHASHHPLALAIFASTLAKPHTLDKLGPRRSVRSA